MQVFDLVSNLCLGKSAVFFYLSSSIRDETVAKKGDRRERAGGKLTLRSTSQPVQVYCYLHRMGSGSSFAYCSSALIVSFTVFSFVTYFK